MMRAVIVEAPGPPEVLRLTERPTPEPRPGWVLIRVRAFGLNRSELLTRQGHSPSVRFPRILGIECVGEVQAAPDSHLQPGQRVAALMGGLGRQYDGSYAEYALVPATQVIPLDTTLDWATLAAIPETFLTAWMSLTDALQVRAGQALLIRGGTSSVGMAAITLARDLGLRVLATTRNPAKVPALNSAGVDDVIIDDGTIASRVKTLLPMGVDQVLELVGTPTLPDSLQTAARHGTVCMTGILSGKWTIDEFDPMTVIPPGVKLTVYTSDLINSDAAQAPLQRIVDGVAGGRYRVNLDRVFPFEDIVAAHQYMEDNRATGKLVVQVA